MIILSQFKHFLQILQNLEFTFENSYCDHRNLDINLWEIEGTDSVFNTDSEQTNSRNA